MSTRQPTNAATPNRTAPIPSRRASALSSSFARSTSHLTSCEMSLTASPTRSPRDSFSLPRDSFSAADWPRNAGSAILPPFLAVGSSLAHDSTCHSLGVPFGVNENSGASAYRSARAGDSPVKFAVRAARRERPARQKQAAPPDGAPPVTRQVRVTKRAPSLPDRAPRRSFLWRSVLLGAPASAASRGWSRVGTRLPCQDHRSVTHFYDGSVALGRPGRDRFVIFIEPAVHMSDRAAWLACAARPAKASTGQPLVSAARRSCRSGFTACG